MKQLSKLQVQVLRLKRQGIPNSAKAYEQLVNSGVDTTLNSVRAAWRAIHRRDTTEFRRDEQVVHKHRGPGSFSHYAEAHSAIYVTFEGSDGAEQVTTELVQRPDPVDLKPVGTWGRYTEYLAKVGTMSGSIILIKGAPEHLCVGDRIEYVETSDLRGCSKAMAPRWQSGSVWKIEDGRIFISKV